MEAIYAGIALIVGSLITGLITLRINRKKNSGTVATSDAASLWNESSQMRQDLRDEVVSLRNELQKTGNELSSAVEQVQNLLRQIELSNQATAAALEETRTARKEAAELRKLLDAVHKEITTENGLSLGQLADNAESRRIAELPKADRTPSENQHIQKVGIQPVSENPDPEREVKS